MGTFRHYDHYAVSNPISTCQIYVVTRYITRGQNQKGFTLPKLIQSSSSSSVVSKHPSQPSTSSTVIELPDLGPSSMTFKQFISNEALSVEQQGATLNCVAVSRMCFKFGRITCPPALVIACEGFSNPLPKSELQFQVPYSHANPPPHYKKHVLPLRNPDLDNGSLKRMNKFLKGGWREVPEDQRWWEQALGGAIEERRSANMELIDGLRSSMDGLRETYFSVE